jgi:molybdopterin converting factor small subunit
MRVRLLGYLGYIVGSQTVEINEVNSLKDVIDKLLSMHKAIDEILRNNPESIILILNGKIVENLEEPVKEGDELVITLPTAGG